MGCPSRSCKRVKAKTRRHLRNGKTLTRPHDINPSYYHIILDESPSVNQVNIVHSTAQRTKTTIDIQVAIGMADGAVQSVISLLAQMITCEVNLIAGLPDDIRSITNELNLISAFLKNADKLAEDDVTVKQWVIKVRLLAFDIENAIEEYQFLQREGTLHWIKDTLLRHKPNIAIAIKDLCQRAGDVRRDRFPYRFDNNIAEQGNVQMARFPFVQEHELVDAQTPKGEIIQLLGVQETNLGRETIAVLGMRGLGKTTVVGMVYNDLSVRDYFPTRAWIAASHTSSPTDMLRSMMKQFYETAQLMPNNKRASTSSSSQNDYLPPTNLHDINSMEEISLQKLIGKYLHKKRYMVVFDDVREDSQLANYVKCVLPDNNLGSKILMTTRYENMAHAWLERSSHGPYKLKAQNSDNAWKLFCRKTFQNNGGKCLPWLDDLARDFTERCEGLPLAILSIAHLLSAKENDLREWKKVHDNIGSCLEKYHHLTGIHKILIGDYHDLKDYLKPCFLYFFLFPKRYAFKRMRLVRLWVAEGFIRKSGCLTLEEVAQEYLNELINMCLLLVVTTDPTGKPMSFRVHDFLHEIIPYKIKELSFCQILSKDSSIHVENPRRLSIHKDHGVNAVIQCVTTRSDISNIRSIYPMEQLPEVYSKILNIAFFKKVYLLKVLDLSNAPINAIPDAVGWLLNLRYLSLRNTRVVKLPSSIGNLQDLQTLDLKQTKIYDLPTEIHWLQKLRHVLSCFYMYDPTFSYHTMRVGGIKMPKGALKNFRELQTLAFVDVGHIAKFTKELVSLTQLRKLGITNLRELDDGRDISVAVEGMIHLETLSVFTMYKYEAINFLEYIESPPPTLKRLYASGRLRSLPGCFLQLQSLLKVRLRWSHLEYDPLQILDALPNVVEIQLLEAYDGRSMQIGNIGFQKLKILHLLDLRNLESLYISKLALPLLEEMSIGESPALSMPTGIQYLPMLKTLNFFGMSESFHNKTRPGMQYNSIVKHVPNVFFHVTSGEGWETHKL